MITLFMLLMIALFYKIIVFSAKAAWGITKVVFTIVFLPVIIIAALSVGLIYLAIPLLIIGGLISLVRAVA